MLTLLIVATAALTAAALAIRHPSNRLNFALLACGLTFYAGREHDLHRLSFLPEHFTRWQFYAMQSVPLWQKICFGMLLLTLITVISLFLFRVTRPFLHGLKQSEPWAILSLVWLITLTISQISDRTWLNDTFAGRAFEEIAEMIAGGLALSVVCFFPRKHTPYQAIDPSASSNGTKAASAKMA